MEKLNIASTYDGMKLPFSLEAEQSVLGAILLDSSCIDKVAEILPRPEYFHLGNHKLIYETLLDMFTQGRTIDFVTLLEELKKNSVFNDSNGKTYLMELAQIVPSISNVENYARIVRDNYDVRTLIITARDIIEDATQGTYDASVLIDSAEQKIFDIRRGKSMQGLQRVNESDRKSVV